MYTKKVKDYLNTEKSILLYNKEKDITISLEKLDGNLRKLLFMVTGSRYEIWWYNQNTKKHYDYDGSTSKKCPSDVDDLLNTDVVLRKLVVFLNCSIITNEGLYNHSLIFLENVKQLIAKSTHIESFIGHESTAQILSEVTGIEIPVNRIKYLQQPGELAVVFQLQARPPEGKILTREEIEKIGYNFYLLERLDLLPGEVYPQFLPEHFWEGEKQV